MFYVLHYPVKKAARQGCTYKQMAQLSSNVGCHLSKGKRCNMPTIWSVVKFKEIVLESPANGAVGTYTYSRL